MKVGGAKLNVVSGIISVGSDKSSEGALLTPHWHRKGHLLSRNRFLVWSLYNQGT